MQEKTSVQLFLNSPRSNQSANLVENLKQFISEAKKTLDIAIYDFRHEEIAKAIHDAILRKVKVRIVYDGFQEIAHSQKVDPKPSGTAETLKKFNLSKYSFPVHEKSGHLMHDKFIIKDGSFLWTGSANFTVGGLELQDNNCLIINSKLICGKYQKTFDDLYTKSLEQRISSKIISPTFSINDADFSLEFSPQNGNLIETEILDKLKKAKKKIRVFAFLISSKPILEQLKTFEKSNIDIQGIIDPNGMSNVTRSTKLDKKLFWFMKDKRFAIAPSHGFNPNGEQNFMHNKTILIDDEIVITGSYNFSENAKSNDENQFTIKSKEINKSYQNYFDKMFEKYS